MSTWQTIPVATEAGGGVAPPNIRGDALAGLTRLDILRQFRGDFGHTLTVLPWWEAALVKLDDARVQALLLNCARQSGKTTLLCAMAASEALLHPGSFTILIAASEGQAQSIYQRKLRRPLEKLLSDLGLDRRRMSITRRGLELLDFGSVIEVIPTSEVSAPGRSPSLILLDEAKDIDDAVFEVLAPSAIGASGKIVAATSAGRPSGWFYGLMTTPAPDVWLHVSSDNVNPRADPGVLAFLQRAFRFLSPAARRRELENEWVAGDAVFISPESWDACLAPTWSPAWPDPDLELFVGVDASVKDDTTAVVSVIRDEADGLLVLATHRIWRPSPEEPMDLEATVETHLRELHARYRLAAVYYDPYQLARSARTLERDGLPMRECPQTVGTTGRMASTLFEVIRGQGIVLYPSEELRSQALNVHAVETARGFRLSKAKASAKIDAITALALACLAALDEPAYVPLRLLNA